MLIVRETCSLLITRMHLEDRSSGIASRRAGQLSPRRLQRGQGSRETASLQTRTEEREAASPRSHTREEIRIPSIDTTGMVVTSHKVSRSPNGTSPKVDRHNLTYLTDVWSWCVGGDQQQPARITAAPAARPYYHSKNQNQGTAQSTENHRHKPTGPATT